jgi:hypothetical protein
MKLVTYGCGNRFEIDKFKPIRNRTALNKPAGGLWASPIDSSHGWKDWCDAEGYGDLSTSFRFEFYGKTLVVDGADDLCKIPWVVNSSFTVIVPDFKRMSLEYDAIHLTKNGLAETRFSQPDLYGWDCECVLIFNKNLVNPI